MLKPDDKLRGLRVVVVGGLGALGAALTSVAKDAGARVAVLDRSQDTDACIADIAIGEVSLVTPGRAKAAFQTVGEAFGAIDVLCNVCGAFEMAPIADGDLSLWLRMLDANLFSTVSACMAALPYLAPGAIVVNTAAAAGARGRVGMGAYSASKAGVLRFTESFAEEISARDLRVYSVSPTILDTPRNRQDMPNANRSGWVDPRELASQILHLIDRQLPSGTNIQV